MAHSRPILLTGPDANHQEMDRNTDYGIPSDIVGASLANFLFHQVDHRSAVRINITDITH